MKKNIFLLPLLFLGVTAYTQEVLKVQNGASITLEAGAEMTVAGGVTLDNGSTLANNGIFTIKQNGASGTGDFFDNTSTGYNYGTGKFVFNSTGKQTLYSNNNFGRIDVSNSGLLLNSNVSAVKWWLAKGGVNTGNYKAVVLGTAGNDLEAGPSNTNFVNGWVNGSLRRYINPATVNKYQFAIGDTSTRHFADLDNLQTNPLTGTQYVDAVFGPKQGSDAGLSVSENGMPYIAVHSAGVWHIVPDATPTSGKYDLKLYDSTFNGLSDNNFAILQRPNQSANAAEWVVPAGSSINPAGGAGRLVADGYALRKSISDFGQFGIASAVPLGGQGTGLQGVYYSGKYLSGNPLLTRIDSTINFELTYSKQPLVLSPAPGIVPEDEYSVRWTGQVQPLYSETYTFYTVSDDGIRLWVNGALLVDNWTNQGATEKSGTITLVAGQKYDIVIEYYENAGEAVTKLYWSSASTPKAIVPKSQLFPPVIPSGGTGLKGTYYNGTALSGTPLLTRIDTTINFELTYSKQPLVLSPAPGIVPEDKYSVRWTGRVQPLYAETYTFYTVSDDGIRLWVNGVLLVDNWTDQGATEKSGTITLVAGQKYDIVIEYYENAGEAVTKLYWSSASTPKTIVPKSQLFPPVETPLAGTGTGLRGFYYSGINVGNQGEPLLLTRIDTTVNFELTYSKQPLVLSPAPGIVPEDMYSVRWAGQVQAQYSETYTFYTVADDGVRLWVNGSWLINDWVNQSATETSNTINLVAGQKYDIFMHYYENTGEAVTKLYWSSPSTPKQIVPKSQLYPSAASSARMMDNNTTLQATSVKTDSVFASITASISPNPVKRGQPARLHINSNKTGAAVITVMGNNGYHISNQTVNLVRGINTTNINTTSLAQGLYLVSITGGNKPLTIKLVVN